ncbi:hypothetical protein D0Z00_002644 [Geotrichum galactomycetum]|uniref:Uncharacterized protein n=1 Tax=Geotrichum galactomycetum TaxID=27317 RepID=A0ACB6V3M8_9ASCO|nr:hypothetical protein D0Z00_002644 [Geotrichum candidum]
MDPLEEQAQEIEVLESIYPDELENVGEKWINPDHDEYDEDEDDEEDEEEQLPGVAPALLELNQKDCLSLHKILEASAEENIGMASVFTLASTVKEEAEAIVQAKFDAAEQERVKEMLRQEAEEQKKFIGTPVTVESFKEWRLKFRAEFKLDEKDHVHTVYDSKGQARLTGRQMFERGISNIDEDEELETGVGNLKV